MSRPVIIRGVYRYRRRVPADVKERFGNECVKQSVNTRDATLARARFPAVAAEFQARFAEIRRGILDWTPEQAEAIVGEIYRSTIEKGRTRRNLVMPHGSAFSRP
jgi:hypothetical protein